MRGMVNIPTFETKHIINLYFIQCQRQQRLLDMILITSETTKGVCNIPFQMSTGEEEGFCHLPPARHRTL